MLVSPDGSPTTAAQPAWPLLGAADLKPSPDHPIGWRGDGGGCYLAARPATQWSGKKNVLWSADIGRGRSSAIVVGQRVFITAEPNVLICLDATTGMKLWRRTHKLSELPADLHAKGPEQSSEYGDATPTPVSDGKSVWVFLGTGVVACYDLEGRHRWIDWFDFRRTTTYARTPSPVLVDDRLLVHFGPLVCLDAATGKLLWKNDGAKATYGTPARARIGNVDVLITPKGHVVRVADGKILAADLGNCTYTSPVVQGNVVYFVDSAMSAVRLPDKAADKIQCKELWYTELTGAFYASPVFHRGRIYMVDRAANYFVIDASSGKTVLMKTLELAPAGGADGPNIYPSLCLAGKHLYLSNDAGETVLLEPGDQGTAVGRNCLPGGSGGTSTFSGNRMFIRGGQRLYCVGGP
jgi:outer membrane protein assembly factor BamB